MRRARWWWGAVLAGLVALVVVSRWLPSLEGRTQSVAISQEASRATSLGKALWPAVEKHPGESGIYALADAHEAFAARVLLARAAEKTLDVQYYIWRHDVTGTILLQELYAAAQRGVRVRMLLDDNGIAGLDEPLAAMDAHPNIEVRLFNPFMIRQFKAIGYLTDFSRANRRMHNKSFTADNQATIVGGRNMGDEYFGAGDAVLFADLDVLAVGAVIDDVSRDFDAYWASESSYPADRIIPDAEPGALEEYAQKAEEVSKTDAAAVYVKAVRETAFIAEMLEGGLQFEWAKTRMVSDPPEKGLGEAGSEELLTAQLAQLLGRPESAVDLVSPYFVPTAAGVDVFTAIAQQGVQLRVLTNSLIANDVAAVHAGYAKRRKDLLAGGVELFEMRGAPEEEGGSGSGSGVRPGSGSGSGSGSGGGSGSEGGGPFGSSGSSLHAKTFAVDGKRVFVGSFNFDPRSAKYNTELGFIIESPAMARDIAKHFDEDLASTAYKLRLDEEGEIVWIEQRDGRIIEHETEPDTTALQRAMVRVMSWLPIESLL